MALLRRSRTLMAAANLGMVMNRRTGVLDLNNLGHIRLGAEQVLAQKRREWYNIR